MSPASSAPIAALPFPARIGLGTWQLGDSRASSQAESAAVLHALELGYRLVDTAEMYGSGGAERVVGAAVRSFGSARRDELCLVSKVLPGNASRRGTIAACEASLERLGIDYLDVYLLHWRGHFPLEDTLAAFNELRERRLIHHFGVSNFDVADLAEWRAVEARLGLKHRAITNQVHYCLSERGIEFDLLPEQRRHRVSTMAYTPLGSGALAHHPLLAQLGAARGATAAQVALAWTMRAADLISIPKSVHPERLAQNFQASTLTLTDAELAALDAAFPPPRRKQPLAMV
jgi:diketogulonate reductase-like aldo/keto reductase